MKTWAYGTLVACFLTAAMWGQLWAQTGLELRAASGDTLWVEPWVPATIEIYAVAGSDTLNMSAWEALLNHTQAGSPGGPLYIGQTFPQASALNLGTLTEMRVGVGGCVQVLPGQSTLLATIQLLFQDSVTSDTFFLTRVANPSLPGPAPSYSDCDNGLHYFDDGTALVVATQEIVVAEQLASYSEPAVSIETGSLIVEGHIVPSPYSIGIRNGKVIINGEPLPWETDVAIEERRTRSMARRAENMTPEVIAYYRAVAHAKSVYLREHSMDAAISSLADTLAARNPPLRATRETTPGGDVVIVRRTDGSERVFDTVRLALWEGALDNALDRTPATSSRKTYRAKLENLRAHMHSIQSGLRNNGSVFVGLGYGCYMSTPHLEDVLRSKEVLDDPDPFQRMRRASGGLPADVLAQFIAANGLNVVEKR